MKKSSKALVTLLFCLSIITATLLPTFAASVGKVGSVKATNVTYNSATITWGKVSKASGYQVEQYNASKKKWVQVGKDLKSSVTSLNVSKLTTGTTYKYRVRAFSKSVFGKITYGAYSSTLSVKPMPAKPASFKATPKTQSIVLSWGKVSGATGYYVQQYNSSSKKWVTVSKPKTNTVEIKKLKINTTYSFRVAAYRTVSKKTYVGSYTSTLKATTALGQVTSFKVSSVKPASAKLSWKAVSEAKGYYIKQYNSSTKKWTTVKTVDAKTLSYTLKTTPNTSYKMCVTAYVTISKKNYTGKDSSAVSFKTTVAPATNLKASQSTPTSVALTWTKASNVTGYYVQQYISKTWKTIKTTTGASYTVENLVPGTKYSFRVVSYYSSSKYCGAATSTASITPTVAAAKDLKASSGTPTSVVLSWTKASGVSGYLVQQSVSGKWTTIKTTTGASYTVQNLVPATQYSFRVVSYYSKESYTGAATNTVNYTPTVNAPSELKSTQQKSTSVSLSWKAASSVSGYIVEQKDGSSWKAVADVKTTSATVSGLSANTSYQFRVCAYFTVGSNNYKSAYTSAISCSTTLAKVTGIKGESNISGSALKITWDAVANAAGYTVKISGLDPIDASSNKTFVPYLDRNTVYDVTVTAYSSAKVNGEESDTAKLKTNIGTTIKNFKYDETLVPNDADKTFVLTWDKIDNAVYTVENYSYAGDGTNPWSVVDGGEKIAANRLEIKTGNTFSVSAKSSGDYATEISWEEQADNEGGYTIQAANVNTGIWEDLGTFSSSPAKVYLAPNTKYTIRVISSSQYLKYRISAYDTNSDQAIPASTNTELIFKQYPYIYGTTTFTTSKAPAFNSSSNESKTAYTLMAVEALNNTKYETGKVKIRSVSEINASLSESTIEINGKSIDFSGLLSMFPSLSEDLTESLNEKDDTTITFNNAVGSTQATQTQYVYDADGSIVKDADGKYVTKEVTKNVDVAINTFVTPNSRLASFYNSQDINNFGKKVSGISVSTSGSKTTVTIKLLSESTTSTTAADKRTPVHSGFMSGLSDDLDSFNDTGSSASLTVGGKIEIKTGIFSKDTYENTILTFVINADGTLDSYKVQSPLKLTMDASFDSEDSGTANMHMIMSGLYNYNYTFTR
ncbi:MAG: fibronectin type III domain-containing protein [Acutalibacteraceae bacterium]